MDNSEREGGLATASLTPTERLDEVRDTILEALADYKRWWNSESENDKEKRERIDRTVEVMKNIK